jgi:hypothetical protein
MILILMRHLIITNKASNASLFIGLALLHVIGLNNKVDSKNI